MTEPKVIELAGEVEGKFVKYEDYLKLKSEYDKLDNWHNSQCRKLEKQDFEKVIEQFRKDNEILFKRVDELNAKVKLLDYQNNLLKKTLSEVQCKHGNKFCIAHFVLFSES